MPGIAINANFDLGTGLPLDSRLVQASVATRNALDVTTQRYEGMEVFVVATQKNYQLRGGIADANWFQLIDSGEPALGNPGIDGYVLSSTAAGVRSWIASGGGMVYPGAGIANSTGTAWTTPYTVTGTGTVVALQTSPTFINDVFMDGTAAHSLQFKNSNVLKGLVGIAVAANDFISGAVAGDLLLRSQANNILFTTDSGFTTQLYLKNGGNVGIGTITPISKLEVSAAGSGYWNNSNDWVSQSPPLSTLTITSTTNGGYDSVLLFKQSTSTGVNINSGAIGLVGTNAWTNGVNASTISDMYFAIRNNAGGISERMRIKADGSIGIGTISPVSKQEIYLDTSVDTATRTVPVKVLTITSNGYAPYTGYGPTLVWRSNVYGSAVTDLGSIAVVMGGTYSTEADMVFSTRGSSTVSERMRIIGSGYVGIGTATPGSDLQIGTIATGGTATTTPKRISMGDTFGTGTIGTNYKLLLFENNGTGKYGLGVSANLLEIVAGATADIGFYTNQSTRTLTLYSAGTATFVSTVTATNFILISDERLKINIKRLEPSPVNIEYFKFELKAEPGQIRYGFIAQRVQRHYPEFVREDSGGILSLSYLDIILRKVAYLEWEVKQLKKRLN